MPSYRHFSMNPAMSSLKWFGTSAESLPCAAPGTKLLWEGKKTLPGPFFSVNKSLKLWCVCVRVCACACVCVCVCVCNRMDTITLRVQVKSCHFWSKGTGKQLLTPGKTAGINAGFRSNPDEGWDHWECSVIQCLSKTKSQSEQQAVFPPLFYP